MMQYLSCQEKVYCFESQFLWLQRKIKRKYTKTPTGFAYLLLSKKPIVWNVSIDTLTEAHKALDFVNALKVFIAQHQDLSDHSWHHTWQSAQHTPLPIWHIDVWYQAKFTTLNVQSSKAPDIVEVAYATPPWIDCQQQNVSKARFDMVLVNASGTKETGVEGELNIPCLLSITNILGSRFTCCLTLSYLPDSNIL